MSRTVLAAGCIGLINRYGWLDRPTGTIEYGTNDSPDIGADTMLENASEKGTIDTLPDIPRWGGYSLAQRSNWSKQHGRCKIYSRPIQKNPQKMLSKTLICVEILACQICCRGNTQYSIFRETRARDKNFSCPCLSKNVVVIAIDK